MSESALKQLEAQIKAVRDEAYRDGYDAAMAAICDFARGVGQNPEPQSMRRSTASTSNNRTIPESVTPRGTNRKLVLQVLKSMAPQAAGPTTLIGLIEFDEQVKLPYSSVRNALRQLEEKALIKEVGDTKTWRYIGPPNDQEPPLGTPSDDSR